MDIRNEFISCLQKQDINKVFGHYFRMVRKGYQMSGKDIAEKMNISQQQWSRYECGKSKIDLEKLVKIIFILKINPSHMLSFISGEIGYKYINIF
ncbi:helix-turn-helix transcriptional regulator [Morganella morganii]|uniref:helix-turn-helix domain-containing protein n=3 Tax=Morganella morganii TaxID=582 RepID=UPI000D1FB066|nr:helix-turn-helix transcriptional regulator [Morganella morganii]HAE77082.1 XRE family transcriptional regulator [Morganella sp. (in: enterobacteria)]QXO41482.1 helix-turn-helix transcriptional regulator [Morganella morganii]QXO45180.1 helix-turn-helix transcriptional regulator [Morganella morganii]QXO48685.1 helix-turn-helix transcriptional regulator [Morganella morganii]QXO52550.1 helix-turn-helix transcriptional regulator [Morganella morganii]